MIMMQKRKKSNNIQYIENIRPNNIHQLYHECKNQYVKNSQYTGGSQYTSQSTMEKHFIHMDYHGNIKVNGLLTVPENTVVLVPLCCGMIYILEVETFEFFENAFGRTL